MQKRLCLMIALLSAMVLGAWADGASSFGGGDGSVGWNETEGGANGTVSIIIPILNEYA